MRLLRSSLVALSASVFTALSASAAVAQTITSLPGTPQPPELAPSAPSPASTDPGTLFRSGVDLVALNVIVTDSTQKHVRGLLRGDFAVYEDGVQQDVAFFSAGSAPIDLAILLDMSSSMHERLTEVHEAAIGFARSLRSGDRAAVIGFSDGVRVLEGFTGEMPRVEAAIATSGAQGGTALHNAIYVTLKEFAKLGRQSGDIRRQAMVVLSDGDDTASLLTFDDVLGTAKQAGVSIYTITLKSKFALLTNRTNGRRYFSQSEFAMKTLAQETGGQSYFPTEIRELASVYGAISQELANQYALGYASRNPRQDGVFRRIVVRLTSNLVARLRTRTGYLASRTLAVASNAIK